MTQELLNPLENGEIEFPHNDQVFRQGDRVIHLVNDTENNVFNGDLGYISDLLPAKYSDSKQDEMTICFEGAEVTYPRNEWYKITLAYAMSIHKSQGSEFQVVILPITHSSHRMLQRNLIYTAITRSKSKLILLGQLSAFDQAVKNAGTARRTYLVERFLPQKIEEKKIEETQTEQINSIDKQYRPANEEPQKNQDYLLTEENLLTIDPMIGLTEGDIEAFFKK